MFRTLAALAFGAVVAMGQTVTTTDVLGQTIVVEVTSDPLGNPLTQTVQTLTVPAAAATPTTVTTVNADGLTVVAVLSSDVEEGVTSTRIVSTVSQTTTPLTNTVATTSTAVQQGPVGEPTSTNSAQPTVYTYTTTDANGQTIAVADTFTPTFPPSVKPSVQTSGTVWAYSDYTASFGTSAAAGVAAADAATSSRASLGALTAAVFFVAGAFFITV